MRNAGSIVAVFVVGGLALTGGAGARNRAFDGDTPQGRENARALSRGHLQRLAARHGLAGEADLRERRVFVDELGMGHRHVQQTHRGVPLRG